MESDICLDSDILIDILRNSKETINKIVSLKAIFSTTAINAFEIWAGRKTGKVTGKMLSSMNILEFNKKAAIITGDLRKKLRRRGCEIDTRDLFIAAICVSNNLPLLTNNKKHFEKLKDLGLTLV
jgi:tRNA(fMet)-specific endonuclease VapC